MATTPDPGLLSQWYDSYTQKNPSATTQAAQTTAPDTSQVAQGATASASQQTGLLATPAQAAVTQWTPGAASTVQGQLGKVLDSGSPLLSRAETKAAQGMNQRGLLNSTMALTAGQSALYDAALPIAQQDAATFTTAGKANADAMNAASQQAAGFAQQSGLQAADIGSQQAMQSKDLASRYDLANMDVQSRQALQAADIQNQQKLQAANAALQTGLQTTDLGVKQAMQEYDAALKQSLQGSDNENKLALATLDANTKQSLAKIEAEYKNGLQQSQSMAGTYQSMVGSITSIMLDPNLDQANKQTAINNAMTLYNNTLAMQSDLSGLKLGTLLIDPLTAPSSSQNSGVDSGSLSGGSATNTTLVDNGGAPVPEYQS
jgi:hypothetical protein